MYTVSGVLACLGACTKGYHIGKVFQISCCSAPRWSLDAGVRNRQDPDFVTKDLWLLDKIQEVCQAAGFGNPLPTYVSQYKRAKELGECPRVERVPCNSAPASQQASSSSSAPASQLYNTRAYRAHPTRPTMLACKPCILHDC